MPLLLSYAILFTIDYRFYDRMGWSLDGNVIKFVYREPENTRVLIAHEFGQRGCVILCVTILLAILAASTSGIKYGFPEILKGLLCLSLMFYAKSRGANLPPVPNLISSIFQAYKQPSSCFGFDKPSRQVLPEEVFTSRAETNILLIVCESLSNPILNSLEGRKAAPRYHAFLEKHLNEVTSFPRAFANSTASEISYTSLFTGLAPDESKDRFHRNPLMWSIAKIAGYRTMLFSSQSLKWQNMEKFLIDESLDCAIYREVLGAPAINDLAMDDRIINQLAISEITKGDTPFFSIVNYNMLHAPFYFPKGKGSSKFEGNSDRYLNALGFFDECFGDLLNSLSASGKLETTTVVFTADHGETPESFDEDIKRRLPIRLDDLSYDNLNIPFWIRFPSETLTPEQNNQLQVNAQRSISNLDIYPTILDLIGIEDQLKPRLCSGQSLLKSISKFRKIIALNTNETRNWAIEPFAIADDKELLIYHDISSEFELLDIDNLNEKDRWQSLPKSCRDRWLTYAAGSSQIGRILDKRNIYNAAPTSHAIAKEYSRLAYLKKNSELHKLNNWVLFSYKEWEAMCLNTAKFIGIERGENVFEAGCGAGAFLDVLRRFYNVSVAGVDLTDDLIAVAKNRLPGQFWTGSIDQMLFVPSNTYDKVISQGVFLYLPSRQVAEQAAIEMIRIAKPGSTIYIGCLNDPEKQFSYPKDKRPSGNYFLGRDYWLDFASRFSLKIDIVDQGDIFSRKDKYDGHARLRYSVKMYKNY